MQRQSRIRTGAGVLTDEIRESAVDDYELGFRRRWTLTILGILLLLVIWIVWSVRRDHAVDYSDIQEHFKYGSIGSETGGSLLNAVGGVLPPYWIFRLLPEICPEKLPGGYASLGLIFEPGKDLPIGVSKRRRLGIDQVGFNCALCHTGTVRDSPGSQPRIVPGMPSHQLDLEALIRFVLDATLDERVTPENVLGRIKAHGVRLGPIESLIDRYFLIDRLKIATLGLQRGIAPLMEAGVPLWGRGRVDTFNPYKSIQFGWRLDKLPHDELIGAADFPSLWNQQPRAGLHLHWDGNNDSVDERNLSAALGAGVTPVTVDHPRIKRVRDWIWTLPPPKYPYEVDDARAARGKELYDAHCAECHAFGAPKTGQVTPLAEIGTDPYRVNSYTYQFAVNQSSLYPESDYRFTHFRKTNGYANHPLDGIWARAPYLHNGSVPNLRDLLELAENRPKQFRRGYDVYDKEGVGFVTTGAEAEKMGTLYDTAVPGNGNGGHTYGTNLTSEQKQDLVEYLKKL